MEFLADYWGSNPDDSPMEEAGIQVRLAKWGYSEHRGEPGEWSLEPFDVADVMLIVGRNATGKSRTLATILAFAQWIIGKRPVPQEGHFSARFVCSDGATVFYEVRCVAGKVQTEKLTKNSTVLLERQSSGGGSIQAHLDSGVCSLPFQIEQTALAVAAKRDLRLHPFLEPLHAWAAGLRYYPFGSSTGREDLVIEVPGGPRMDPSDWRKAVWIFLVGQKECGSDYVETVKRYMSQLGYEITGLDARQPGFIPSVAAFPWAGPPKGLAVQEKGLGDHWVDQLSMSQGMFRVLALLVHLTYALMAKKPSCVLVDDVGEGLDFKRSVQMIELLLELGKQSGSQILMATNDRFVMNAVPLKHWAVLLRHGGQCRLRTYQNAPERFDAFSKIGLNHFDLFSSGYLDDDGEEGHEETRSVC